MTQNWWGREVGSCGWAILLYEWVYTPFCKWISVEPWSLTKYGLISLGVAIVINLLQYSLDMQPMRRVG